MKYRRLGRSGLAVSLVGLGCDNFGHWGRADEKATREVVSAALDAGITLFDTADVYGESEVFLGNCLKRRRDDVVIATKFGRDLGGDLGTDQGDRGSRRYVRRAVERSLKRLQTDWIDLYQIHKPDLNTPIDETLSVLSDLVHEGKVRYIGESQFAAWQISDAAWTAQFHGFEHFVSAQHSYSLFDRKIESEVVPVCALHGLGILPYRPLANGLLTGKYRAGQPAPVGSRLARERQHELTAERLQVVEKLEEFGAERGRTVLEVAIAGLAAFPHIASVIAGATKPEQIWANVNACNWEPDAADVAELQLLTQEFF